MTLRAWPLNTARLILFTGDTGWFSAYETFQAVQAEIERRRELGALANPHIPTSCFTSKIKCVKCGKSYRRHLHKRVNDTIANWECRTKGEKGKSFCDAKAIPEMALKEACCKVLGLSEFDEFVFTEMVDGIIVHNNNLLVVRMKNGKEINQTWEHHGKSKKEVWTSELRDKVSAYRKRHPSKKKGTSCFTCHVRCEKCGANFNRQTGKRASGERYASWYCSSHRDHKHQCDVGGIFDDVLKRICSEAMGVPEFDEDTFKAQIDHVGIPVRGTVIVYFKDGRTFHGTWSTKKKMPPLSDERKRLIGEASKRYWRERKCQM